MCDGGGLSPPSPLLSPLCAVPVVQCGPWVRPLSVCSYFVLYRTFLLSARARKTDGRDEGGGVAATALIAKRASERASSRVREPEPKLNFSPNVQLQRRGRLFWTPSGSFGALEEL